MTVSIRKTKPNLSYIFSQLFFIRCLILAPGQRSFWQLVNTSPSNRGWNRRPKKVRMSLAEKLIAAWFNSRE
jgi:hypothetical protein